MFTAKPFVYSVLAFIALFALSCSTNTDVPLNMTVTSRISSENSLIAFVDIKTDVDSRVYVEYGNDEIGYFKTRVTSAQNAHSVPLVRLRESTLYNFKVSALDNDNAGKPQYSGSITSGPLPGELNLGFTATGKSTFKLAVMDVRLIGPRKNYILIVDSDGKIVWYYYVSEGPSSIHAIRQKSNANLVYIVQSLGIFEITPIGEKVNELLFSAEENPHHELLIENDNSVIYLSEQKDVDSASSLRYSLIRRWDQSKEEISTLWNPLTYEDKASIISEIYAPFVSDDMDDHSNSLFIGKRGNILLSRRHLNQVISIAPGWKGIEWKLGGVNSSFTFEDPTDYFYAQHTPIETKEGNIVLFDNGNGRPESEGGEYSRALELALDPRTKKVKKVWEHRPEENIFVSSLGGLERLDNGNTLISFGRNETLHKDPIILREVDKAGKIVWDLSNSPEIPIVRYRGSALESINGEVPVK